MINDLMNNNNINNSISKNVSVIQSYKTEKKFYNTIYNLAHNYSYVNYNVNIIALAEELEKKEDIHSICVVDDDRKILGIIIKKELFSILSKLYGRDVFKNKNVTNIMKDTKIFHEESNILLIAEELKNELKLIDNNYYILVNGNNQFTGVFTTKSILIYLSDIMQRDLDLAQKLQRRIVKDKTSMNENNFNFAAISKMAKGVGGDFYSIKKISKHKWIIVLCDVSGKGISASLLTSILGGMINSYDFNNGLKKFIKILNNYVYTTFNHEKFITGIFIEFNDKTGEISLSDMGHSYAYIYKNDNIFKIKIDKNFPVGISNNIEPSIKKYKFNKNDILLIYTDGIVEQTNKEGIEYSDNRIKKILKKYKKNKLNDIMNFIIKDLDNFKKTHHQKDDITLMMLKYKK